MLRKKLSACLLLALSGGVCHNMAAAGDVASRNSSLPLAVANGFDIRVPVQETVLFRGGMSLDAAGGPQSQILYPAVGGLGGFLVGIATHGVLVETGKEREKTRIQQEADKILDPYRESISKFTFRQLAERALQKDALKGFGHLIGADDRGEGFVVKTEPVFTLTSDRRALVLENVISVFRAGIPSDVLYSNVFRVVSDPRSEDDLESYWGKDNARQILAVSQEMFVRSLKIATSVVETSVASNEMEKTIRYFEGGAKLIERGQVMEQLCGRVLGRNLRGWVISVPTGKFSEEALCETAKL